MSLVVWLPCLLHLNGSNEGFHWQLVLCVKHTLIHGQIIIKACEVKKAFLKSLLWTLFKPDNITLHSRELETTCRSLKELQEIGRYIYLRPKCRSILDGIRLLPSNLVQKPLSLSSSSPRVSTFGSEFPFTCLPLISVEDSPIDSLKILKVQEFVKPFSTFIPLNYGRRERHFQRFTCDSRLPWEGCERRYQAGNNKRPVSVSLEVTVKDIRTTTNIKHEAHLLNLSSFTIRFGRESKG